MGDTVQTGTEKFDPAWKCKFTTAARELNRTHSSKEIFFRILLPIKLFYRV